MDRFRLFAPLLAAMALMLGTPARAAEKWLRADTHNFVIYSSGSSSQLQEFAENLEMFDALLRLRTRIERDPEPNRLTIFVLAQPGDVAKLVGDKQRMVAGMYLPRQDGSFAIANRARGASDYELSGNTVLFHEYAHHFMFRYFTAPYPAWFVEGFAEFYSTAEIKPNGEWRIGKPAYHRAHGLLAVRKPPIDSLLFGQAVRKSVDDTDSFYGRSWLLVHMLGMDPAYAGKLDTFLRDVGGGKPHKQAAIDAFGDLATLDKSLDRYLGRSTVTVLSSKRAVSVDGQIAITELDPTGSELVALSLKRRFSSDPAKARDALVALAAKASANAEVWYELAKAEQQMIRDGADEAAKTAAAASSEAAVDKALAINPDHVRANVLKARLQFDKLQAAGDDRPASWIKARSFIVKANAKASLDPEPLTAWYDSYGAQGREPTKNASEGLQLAFLLAPEVSDLRAKHAFDLARLRRFDEAIRLVEPLAYDPHNSEAGQALLAVIKTMRDNPDVPVKVEIQRSDKAPPKKVSSPIPQRSDPSASDRD